MDTSYQTLPFFCRSQEDVLFEIHEILSDETHPQHGFLISDLNSIGDSELQLFVDKHHINSRIGRWENKNRARRIFFLIDAIQHEVAAEILNEISRDKLHAKPYNSLNLRKLSINDNNLASIKSFTIGAGFEFDEFAYDLCPVTNGSNSSYWLKNAITEIHSNENIDFLIRLHPFLEVPINEYHPMQYKMYVYGLPLHWENLRNLKADDFGQWFSDKDYHDYHTTDYVWHPTENEVHFTCEELPVDNAIHYRGSRYFHAIFGKSSGMIIHCDGAVRIYTDDELAYRKQFHVRHAEVRKIGKRVKIFQADKVEISRSAFTLLATSFFVWNDDVQAYFH